MTRRRRRRHARCPLPHLHRRLRAPRVRRRWGRLDRGLVARAVVEAPGCRSGRGRGGRGRGGTAARSRVAKAAAEEGRRPGPWPGRPWQASASRAGTQGRAAPTGVAARGEALATSAGESPVNGGRPHSSSYSTAPSEYTSRRASPARPRPARARRRRQGNTGAPPPGVVEEVSSAAAAIPKSITFTSPPGAGDHVARLHVPVHDPALVGGVQRVGDGRDPGRFGRRERPRVESGGQGLPPAAP